MKHFRITPTPTPVLVRPLLLLAPIALLNAQGNLVPVDLSTWIAEDYPAVSGFGDGSWTVAEGNEEVVQTINGQPTFFYSDFQAFQNTSEGRIRVTGGSDDDYVGFAIGFQPGDTTNPEAEYLLIDWKRGTQSYNFGAPSTTPGSLAPRGLAVSRVFGIPTADELWGHVNFDDPISDLQSGLEELARAATLGDTGWERNRDYLFTFEFSQTSLKVQVDGVLELDVTGRFQDGRLAFYNFSQAGVRYSGFERPFRITDTSRDEDGFIELTWSSYQGAEYRVWASPDIVGSGWIEVGSAVSQGTSTSWVDPTPATGTRFYRIEQK